MSTTYDESSIKILSDIQHIQLRKGMYVGEADNPKSLLSEIFDNAIDEVQAGFSSHLEIHVDTSSNVYTVRDFGRGIPHGTKTLETGETKEILEILLTKANSGGKFDNESYNYSSGLNGLGLTVTNALSNWIRISSYRKKKAVIMYSEGGTNNKLLKEKTTEPDGTLVEFQPNPSMFHSSVIPTDFMIQRCKIANALGFKSKLFIDEVEIDTSATMFDLIQEDTKITTYVDIPVIEVTNADKEKMKTVLRYTSDTHDKYYGFTNLLSNYLGGTHVQCLSKAVIESWEELLVKYKNLRPVTTLNKSDYLIGLRAVCAVFISKPEFSSQTKEKLVVNKKYFDELMTRFKKEFKKYLEDNILIAQQLIKRFEEYRISQNSLLSRKEISSLIKVNEDNSNEIRRRSVVSKLRECTSKKRDNTELFIVEGDSALGPYLYVRDRATQAILPIRGKILNTTFKDLKEIVKNNEICDIANSMGCGIGSGCDASKSRYERIIISADADPDGLQINCLVLAVFINCFPDMVKQGRVYVSVPPLYCWGDDEKSFGWCNSVDEIPTSAKNVQRFKGLGEMNPPQLKYFLCDPDTRNVIQLEYPSNVDEFNKILGTSEGKFELLQKLGIIEGV